MIYFYRAKTSEGKNRHGRLVALSENDALTKIDAESEKTMGKYTKGLPF